MGKLNVLHLHVIGLLGELAVKVVLLRLGFKLIESCFFLGNAFFEVQLLALLHLLGILRLNAQPLILRQVGVSELPLVELNEDFIHAVGVLLIVLLPRGIGDAVQRFFALAPFFFSLEPVFSTMHAAATASPIGIAATSTVATVGDVAFGGDGFLHFLPLQIFAVCLIDGIHLSLDIFDVLIDVVQLALHSS